MSQPITFSIVTAVYNVARYLDDFIESVEGQTFARDRFEVIAVDDGSTDDSLEKLRAWEARCPGGVRVLSQENGGQAAARNAGLILARGEWVTFADPDDLLDPAYLAEVAGFIGEHPGASMLAARILLLDDATGMVSDTHPLRRRFVSGNRLRSLEALPDHFHGSAPTAFVPLEALRRHGITFDPRVRPNFEDGHFCARYLLAVDDPTIGFVATAQYLYRKRDDASSSLQRSLGDRRRYSDVLRFGYLDVLERAAASSATGRVPEWLQQFVVYELSWYLSSQDRVAGAVSPVSGPLVDEFHGLMRQIVGRLSKDVIATFSARPLRPEWRYSLLQGYVDDPWHADWALLDRLDADQGLVRLSYFFTGEPPHEVILGGGDVVSPVHAKIRDIRYHGRVLLRERIAWVSARESIRLRLDGRAIELRFSPPRRTLAVTSRAIRQSLGASGATAHGKADRLSRSLGSRLTRRAARSWPIRRLFRNAWVLMDRVHDANDSAEVLFRYLRSTRPDINAWFVVERGSADWKQLRADGHRRLVSYGSLAWRLLMLNCRQLISSHADVPIVNPPALIPLTRRSRWRFTFLQHGVIKDDLSAWLNPKPIDLFVTSTPDEYASIASDHTPYTFTSKEVKLVGLPRFDQLHEAATRVAPGDRDLVLVAPTWRNWLTSSLEPGSQRRQADAALLESELLASWTSLLVSERLAAIVRDAGLKLGFLPHPNLQPALPHMTLPQHVVSLAFDRDVHAYFARTALLVTDYSSMAFNAAYLRRPVVYFQFDRDRVLGGEHVGRAGYFDYHRDGFGPVAETLDETVDAIASLVAAGCVPQAPYQGRTEDTFPFRDGRCCERVVEEIERSTRRV